VKVGNGNGKKLKKSGMEMDPIKVPSEFNGWTVVGTEEEGRTGGGSSRLAADRKGSRGDPVSQSIGKKNKLTNKYSYGAVREGEILGALFLKRGKRAGLHRPYLKKVTKGVGW